MPTSGGPGQAADETSDDAVTSVVSMYVKQQKIYARAVSGWFAGWRWAMVWATQLVFYGLPWLPWNDRQAVLFDLGARRFYIFGMVLYPLSAFRAMNQAAAIVYETLRTHGTQKNVTNLMQTRAELYDVLGYLAYEQKLDALFSKREDPEQTR